MKKLKEEYQELNDDWELNYNNCSCHIDPPCSSCTHEGNPSNLEETPEAWENVLPLLKRWVYNGHFMWGEIYDDDIFEDGTVVQTSGVLEINEEEGWVKTTNTKYELGEAGLVNE